MNSRWYISTLIIILTFLGVVSQQQISIPNQEIVLQFADVEVASNKSESAVAIIKKQLLALGVHNIQVKEGAQGSLKITYYSDIDVASIKKALSKGSELKLDYTSYNQDTEHTGFPSDDTSFSYDLDIYEIQKGNDLDGSLEGYVLEFKTESDRFSTPNNVTFINKIDDDERSKIEKVAYKVNRNIAIAIDNTSHIIPEVRAGPAS